MDNSEHIAFLPIHREISLIAPRYFGVRETLGAKPPPVPLMAIGIVLSQPIEGPDRRFKRKDFRQWVNETQL